MEPNPRELVEQALGGSREALETLLLNVRDLVYNLSLRMLGTPQDAEDATQEICIKLITNLNSYRGESAFSTWVYRVASNHLCSSKKSFFSKQPPLSFDFYAADIEAGYLQSTPEAFHGVEEELLTQELKASCTNVMLQCFDPKSRLIYVLGTMFQVDSKTGGEILGITPESYRKRLSRLREKMSGFLSQYCGLSATGKCNCQKRLGYAIANHRLNPDRMEYTALPQAQAYALRYTKAMEEMDDLSAMFAGLPKYRSPQTARDFLARVLSSQSMQVITAEAKGETA